MPRDEREFPDLSPVRDRDARTRDGRAQRDWVQDAPLPEGSGHAPNAPAYAPAGSGQAWQEQPWSSPQAATQQAPVRQEPAQQTAGQQPRGRRDAMEAFSERWRRRGGESREDRRADRRKRRRQFAIGGGAAVVVIAVAVYFLTSGGGSANSGNLGLGSLVMKFLPGELQQVPDACDVVPGTSLSQYLPGQLKVAAPPLNSGASSQCTWTLDNSPTYRVLEVGLQAYSPSGLASGDGSATFAAEDAYAEAETTKQKPGPRSGQPKATVTDLAGMPGGDDTSAFEATQVFTVNGAVTDVATVVVRYRNVIVTVVLDGLDHANKGKYGPVSMSDLSSAAQTVAQQVSGKLVH